MNCWRREKDNRQLGVRIIFGQNEHVPTGSGPSGIRRSRLFPLRPNHARETAKRFSFWFMSLRRVESIFIIWEQILDQVNWIAPIWLPNFVQQLWPFELYRRVKRNARDYNFSSSFSLIFSSVTSNRPALLPAPPAFSISSSSSPSVSPSKS